MSATNKSIIFVCVEVSNKITTWSKNEEVKPTHFFISQGNHKADQSLLEELKLKNCYNVHSLQGRFHFGSSKDGDRQIF